VDLSLLLPVIILAAAGSAVLLIDLVIPRGASRGWLLYLALAGVVATALATLPLIGRDLGTVTTFGGMFAADGVAIFFWFTFLIALALALLASSALVDQESEYPAEFYSLMLFCTVGLMLMASSAELMSIYLALELASLSLAFLATWMKRDLISTEAGMKYFIISVLSSAVMLYGMALLYGLTGTTLLRDIGPAILANPQPATMLAVSMLVAGFGFKISAVPFQMWTPDVYEGAPTPVTAFLSVASKAAGFAVLMRVFTVALPGVQVEWAALVAGLAAVTMSVGNVIAIVQGNVKRMLAYSSIAQAGYALIGVALLGLGNDEVFRSGLASTLFFLLVYTFSNMGAFIAVMLASQGGIGERMESYSGLSQRAPLLALALTFSLLSLAGLPLFAGFFSKFVLFQAAIQGGMTWLVIVAVVNSAVSLFYYSRIIRQMYLVPAETDKPVPVAALPALSLLGSLAGVVLLGLVAAPFLALAQTAGLVR